MREYLYYTPTLTLGLAGMLFAQRSTEDTKRWVAPIGVGVCMGLGWWMSPFIAYFGIGVVLILLQSKTLSHKSGLGSPSLGSWPEPRVGWLTTCRAT